MIEDAAAEQQSEWAKEKSWGWGPELAALDGQLIRVKVREMFQI